MQLSSGPSAGRKEGPSVATFGANETGRRIAGLRDRLQEILRERSAAEQAFEIGRA